MTRCFLTMPINHCRFKLHTHFSLQSRFIFVSTKHLFLQIYLFIGLNRIQDKYNIDRQIMQNCPEWKITLRKEIYRQNYASVTSTGRKTQKRYHRKVDEQTPKQYLAWKIYEHLRKGYSRCIESNENSLPSYQSNPLLSFYIPIRSQVLLPSDIEYIFGRSLGSGNKKSKKVQEMAKFLKLQDQQITLAQKWSFLLQKYICPLDVFQRIELFVNLLKYGTQKLESLFLFKYPHLEPKVLFQSIISMNRYFQQPKQIQSTIQTQKTKLSSQLCQYCSVYNCINHIPTHQKDKKSEFYLLMKQSKRSHETNDNLIDSLIQLLGEIKNIYINRNHKFKSYKDKACSLGCYRNLSYREIQARYKQFYVYKESYDSAKLKALKSIFGYNPCSISKAFQSKCDKVLILLLLQSQNSSSNLAGIFQADSLKNKEKTKALVGSGGCSCKKGECSTNKCDCFANKRECNSQTCLCQPVLAGLFASPQFCLNQNVISGRHPHLKVGMSDRDHDSLGLFTMNAIRSQQIVFWVSGKLYIENCWNDLDEWFLNKSGKKACNIIFGNTNGKTLGGKQRFVCHRNSKDANLKQTVKWVNGIEYTVFLATRDLQAEQQLFLACKCCLFQ